jgi:predicted O-methyltransferase YrrM
MAEQGRVGRRRFDYDRRLLPHPYLEELEPTGGDPEFERMRRTRPRDETDRAELLKARVAARAKWLKETVESPGYPAWNLLYFTLICSIVPELEDVIVLETGTNHGVSTIVLAQALKELGVDAVVRTVELNPQLSEIARRNVDRAGLSNYVQFNVGDSIDFLEKLTADVDHIDFAFIDDRHTRDHVVREIELVCPKVVPRRGKVYFDNTSRGDVAEALRVLGERFGGNLIEFGNCSWAPPGNAIWQPD